jgi:poly-gamma-glutamate synthase PgsB/CapB
MQAGGIRTCAKTTGTLARMIFSDGSEYPIFRPCRANVIEQKRVVRAAVNDSAQALVIECMALQPLLQSVCELKLVRSTLGVITNSRADHLDVMGPTRLDVARALAGTTPVAGKLFTAEHRADCLDVMRAAAEDRGSEFETLSPFEVHRITPEILAGFNYLEHAENIALALRVCETLGVDRTVAIEGMQAATPDPGAMRVFRYTGCGDDWYFVNAFAANDPESTQCIWETAFDRFPRISRRIALMNCRADRPDRSKTMAESCAHWRGVDHFVVTGSGTEAFTRPLLAAGVERERVACLGNDSAERVVHEIARWPNRRTLILGMGNIAKTGLELAGFFERADASMTAEEQRPPSQQTDVSSRMNTRFSLTKAA